MPPLAVLAGIRLRRTDRTRSDAGGARGGHRAGVAIAALLIVERRRRSCGCIRTNTSTTIRWSADLQGADGRYATDYWVNTMPEAVDALEGIRRATNGTTGRAAAALQRRDLRRAPAVRARRQRRGCTGPTTWEEADFFISPTHMKCDSMLEGKMIATVERLGVVIGVVKDRRARRSGIAAARDVGRAPNQ